MINKKLYQEIQGGKNQFHSAILTSYSFNFHHFEHQVLKELRRKWITSVTVMADQRILDDMLGVASSHLKELSQSYTLLGRTAKGAFHPKINFFVGDDKLLLVFGSGNITPGGHGKNHELFTGFYADNENLTQLPLIIECWNYLMYLSKDFEGYSKNLFQSLPGHCDLLKSPPSAEHTFHQLDETTEVALLYNEQSSIFDQLSMLIPNEQIDKITIVSPYFDEEGQTLLNLLKQFSNAKMDVYLSTNFGLPPTKLIPNQSIMFYAWEETKRGKETINSKEEYNRKLHSKFFHFHAPNYEYCLIGSANATVPGLGAFNIKPVNEEFGALYKTSKKGFLSKLGITGTKKKVPYTDLKRDQSHSPGDRQDEAYTKKMIITNVDCFNHSMKIHYKRKTNITDGFVVLFDGHGVLIKEQPVVFSDNETLSIKISEVDIRLNPAYILLKDEEKKNCSNKQLVNFVNKLINTDPSKGNRDIRQVINSISCGQFNEFEVIELINNIQSAKDKKSIVGKSQALKDKDNSIAVSMTYQEAVSAAKSGHDYQIIVDTYSSNQLWKTLTQLFSHRYDLADSDLKNEEEDADTGSSHDRTHKIDDSYIIVVRNSNQIQRMTKSLKTMLFNYLQNIKRISWDKNHKISSIDLSEYLLITHVFTSVCYFAIFEFKKADDELFRMDQSNGIFRHSMFDIIENFAKLWIKIKNQEQPEEEYEQLNLQKLQQQALFQTFLYLCLLDKSLTEDFIKTKLQLIAFNLIYSMGLPDNSFSQYINNMAPSLGENSINPGSIIAFKDELCLKYNNMAESGEFFIIDHSGICQVISENSHKLDYISIFQKGQISPTKFKKLRL
jgi:hypothetical protein